MSSDNNDPRRYPDNSEQNPFVAFRRFADSQVSSLINTLFSPAAIADSPKRRARELCLFGRADPERCQHLNRVEDKTTETLGEALELSRRRDTHAFAKANWQLADLNREAHQLRTQILEEARANEFEARSDSKKQADVVERVANKKAQEWAWSWSWGFPRPFDESDNQVSEEKERHYGDRTRDWITWQEEGQTGDPAQDQRRRWHDFKRQVLEREIRGAEEKPKVWSFSIPWPPLQDIQADESTPSRPRQTLFDMILDEFTRSPQDQAFNIPDESYSPRALEDNETLKKAGVLWRDAFEDLIRAEQGSSLIPREKVGHSRNIPYNQWVQRFWDPNFGNPRPGPVKQGYPKPVPWTGEEDRDEPSYEYSHDHEDQHDDPPTPKLSQGKFDQATPATELEAYERLLGPTPLPSEAPKGPHSSILSTLTTTERTISPDGTVTTKMVLKKRFADGREESSETIHTHRGQEVDTLVQREGPSSKTSTGKKSGWFWSN